MNIMVPKQIECFLQWGPPKLVDTKSGPRHLRKAKPNENWWSFWRLNKQTLKDNGISVGKDRQTGEWEVCWWLPISKEEAEAMEARQQASRATNADIDIPAPAGLEYLPFQKAGVRRALQIFGCI